MGALDYLLKTRAVRERADHFARNVLLLGLAAWLVIIGLVFMANHQAEAAVAAGIGLAILGIVTLTLALALPMRQVHKDAQLHASLHGGRCYQEILGTLLTPREMLDQIAWYSAQTYLRSNALWTALLSLLWLLAMPANGLLVLLAAACWLPLSTPFVWATSYLAQQFSIYNAQLKGGFVHSVGDGLVGVAVGIPVGGVFLAAWVCLMSGRPGLALACYLAYLCLTPAICRLVASTGLERLPHLRHRLQQFSRFWVGRRNRFVWAWSDNPIVVRERHREAGRIPGQWLGAVLFQLPLTGLTLLLLPVLLSDPVDYSGFSCAVMIVFGLLQLLRAGHRCARAIVAEVEQQTMESMQNTRLHARTLVSGWLQIGAAPLVVENLLIALLLASAGPLPLSSALSWSPVFVLAPVLGAALGLTASCASNRQAASRRYSETFTVAALGLGVAAYASCLLPPDLTYLTPSWPVLLLLYGAVAFSLAIRDLLGKIEIGKST